MNNFTWKEGLAWVTYYVTSLYSSIPHQLGIEAVSFYLETETDLVLEL